MAQTDHRSVYETVTNQIIGQLEDGALPWVQPWGVPDGATPLGLPTNGATRNTYSGINILILWGAAFQQTRTTQTWLTFKQALSLGGCVRKGAQGTKVVYADRFISKAEQERASQKDEDPQAIAFLKRYTVFNADQCDGLPEELFQTAEPLPPCEVHQDAQSVISATGADLRIGGHKAFYVPSEDYIQVPPQPSFHAQINYYRTCFHELGHWTGHHSRLNRNFKGRNGSQPYAREELVAELASAFVCAALKIKPTVRHADYIATWLELLHSDDRAIFHAASQASKAADLILVDHRAKAASLAA